MSKKKKKKLSKKEKIQLIIKHSKIIFEKIRLYLFIQTKERLDSINILFLSEKIAVCVGLILLSSFFAFRLYAGWVEPHFILALENFDFSGQRSQLEGLQKQSLELKKELKILEDKNQKYEKVLAPFRLNLSQHEEGIRAAAKKYKIQIIKLENTKINENKFVLKINLKGHFLALLSFFNELENSPQVYELSSLTIQKDPSLTLTAQLDLLYLEILKTKISKPG